MKNRAVILNKWVQKVNSHDIDAVVELYSKDAILLPTLSNVIRKTPLEIRDYFIHFLGKKELEAKVTEVYIQSIYNDDIKVDSGTYTFSYINEQDEKEELAARFTFIIQNGLILEHHSSVAPINHP